MIAPFDFEIRLHRADGTLSLVMLIAASSEDEARSEAREMMRDGLANTHICRDGKLVDSLYAFD